MKLVFIISLGFCVLFFAALALSRRLMPLMNSKMKEQHYDLLKRFTRVCRDHGLFMFPICGTLLGAIRHKGFIPWDNDVDVGMFAPDVQKLLRQIDVLDKQYGILIVKHPNDLYKVFLSSTGKDHPLLHSKACIDIFTFRRNGERIEYASEKHRNTWPREYFLTSELQQLVPYQFGPLTLYGPSNSEEFCARIWGENWRIPRAKKGYQLLYPFRIPKLIKQFQKENTTKNG